MGYLIAAYALVIGSLVTYGIWVQLQRRALMRRAPGRDDASTARGAWEGEGVDSG